MDIVQNILVYITLAIAIGYIVKKFFIAKTLIVSKKGTDKACGKSECGCH